MGALKRQGKRGRDKAREVCRAQLLQGPGGHSQNFDLTMGGKPLEDFKQRSNMICLIS